MENFAGAIGALDECDSIRFHSNLNKAAAFIHNLAEYRLILPNSAYGLVG